MIARRLVVSLACSVVAALAAPLAVRDCRAGTEEFSTFNTASQESDDESLLDHYVTRMPRAWRNEWERAPQAIRTSQGCLTSGQWMIETDLKLRSTLGKRARLALDLQQSETDVSSYDYLDFSFLFPTRFGTPGIMFRPLHDKSRQDFAVSWEFGADTSAYHVRAVFGLEDMFNNLWEWRQTQVGNDSEPYTRHPYEPGLYLSARRARWRAELSGRYLTPSVKRHVVSIESPPTEVSSLWGALGSAAFEIQALGFGWEARASNQQALSTNRVTALELGEDHDFRRAWSAEFGVRRTIAPRLTAETHWIYQDRGQSFGVPSGPGSFRGLDRLVTLEAAYDVKPTLRARIGGLYDEISIAQSGNTPYSYGTRHESRLYLGLIARFGRVSVSATEGIDLDPEPYDLWLVHDKGFLQLQTTF